MFDYSATNINRRDAEFAETLSLPYHNSPSNLKIPSIASLRVVLRSFVLCVLCASVVYFVTTDVNFRAKSILLRSYDLGLAVCEGFFAQSPLIFWRFTYPGRPPVRYSKTTRSGYRLEVVEPLFACAPF